jgi:pimeloyl-ACP methyl ester carboxylesterase
MKLFLDDGGTGKGTPLVLIHGLGCDSTVWSAQLEHLRKSRRVLAPDLRGHGKSEHASEYTVIFVDAAGDVSQAPPEMKKAFLEQDRDLTWPKLQEAFAVMVGPKAKEETKRRVLESAAKMDLKAFAGLRESMLDNPGAELLARFGGPKFAIEVDEPQSGRSASSLPGVKRKTIPDVSHWLMLDDPASVNRAFDEVLAWTG